MPSKVISATIIGIDAYPIEVEVDAIPGIHLFNIVGLPDKAVNESKDRIASAIRNTGLIPPNAKNLKIVVNLAPADIKKAGPAYDLPIAVAYLVATKQIQLDGKKRLFAGELSLDGRLRHINGVLSTVLLAKKLHCDEVILPECNVKEAALIQNGPHIVGISTLSDLVHYTQGSFNPRKISHESKKIRETEEDEGDLMHIKGQDSAKRALEIAAAGGHNILLSGTPGGGKTMLAKALPTILPQLSDEDAIEVTRIYSVAGLLDSENSYISSPPFRNPHHTSSTIAIIGGGTWPRPGEISLAHTGVLFLDEFPEFSRGTIESLRQPVEDGKVTVSRASGTLTLPSRFMLVAAMNPCPCGNYNDPEKACICTPHGIASYKKKISGPIIDRIDINVVVPRESPKKYSDDTSGESSQKVRERVARTRNIQVRRFSKAGIKTNAEMHNKLIKEHCMLGNETKDYFEKYALVKQLSGRSYFRILKLARTIADLDTKELITREHILEAIRYKTQEQLE